MSRRGRDRPVYVAGLRVDGVRGFHGPRACDLDFTRPAGGYAGWTVMAGRNGSGKTTLLRMIALTLTGERRAHQLEPELEGYLTHGATRGSAVAKVLANRSADTMAQDGNELVEARLDWRPEQDGSLFDELVEDYEPPTEVVFSAPRPLASALWSSAPPPGWFCAAYGPFRRLTGTGLYERTPQQLDRAAALRTLFEEQSALTEAFDWLLSLHLRTLEERPGIGQLKAWVLRLLNDGLLPDRYHIEDVDSEGMWLRRQGDSGPEGARTELRRMSDGQRTVIALVLDIVRQMHAAYGDLGFEEHVGGRIVLPHPGVVLIDEIDAHLHMTWQKNIGQWLTTHFPAIQFIVTTHSPYICQAADPGGLIRLPGSGEQKPPQVVDGELYGRIVFGTGDDAALSDLFGLDSPYSDEARELRSKLAELEYDVLLGRADAVKTEEYLRLRDRLSSSPVARVDEVMERYRLSRERDA
ncbi:AAA family ATPase [Streptomyces pristinaespiralis]|uniref:AAA family ATPase n=1 Tax=Streptomyces pristinaespiralis TaxID=38300 RepID=UPI0021752889|nr:AAA family ATPase [Streptomyces pristinaespiralis]